MKICYLNILLILFLVLNTNSYADLLEHIEIRGPRNYFCEKRIADDLTCDTRITHPARQSDDGEFNQSEFEALSKFATNRIKRIKKKIKKLKTPKAKKKQKKKLKKWKQQKRDLKNCEERSGKYSFTDNCNNNDICNFFQTSQATLNSRLLNGQACNAENSAVLKVVRESSEGTIICSAPVISPNAALTYSRCIPEDWTNAKLFQGSKQYTIQNVINHPNFDYEDFSGSSERQAIAIIITDETINASAFSLIDELDLLTHNETVIFAGYGDIGDNDGSTLSYGMGIFIRKPLFFTPLFRYYEVLINEPGRQATPCSGDIGAPLLAFRDNQWVIAGMYVGPSSGNTCTEELHDFIDLRDFTNDDFILENAPGINP